MGPDATLERLEPLADPVWASVAQPRFATAVVVTFATRLMSAMLFGVTPRDALSFAIAPAVLLPIAAVASLVPASRAARVNPVDALRAEN